MKTLVIEESLKKLSLLKVIIKLVAAAFTTDYI
jgi:hypothetical protein